MEEFEVGGKITLEDDKSYIIVDILEEDKRKYLFCCTTKKPILPKVFEQKKINGNVFVKMEENFEIINKLVSRMIDNEKQQN